MLVAYFVPAVFGFLVGLVVGFGLVFVMPGTFRSMDMQLLGGAIIGGVFGAVIGSISGSLNAHSDDGTHKALVAFLTGAIGGALAATRMEALWVMMRFCRIPTPY
jgi:H+/Cl- antiporter ClcA